MKLFVSLCLAACFLLINAQELEDCRADIVFVLDGSGSVRSDNWRKTLEFVWQFASKIPFGLDRNRIGVVSFGNEATIHFELDKYNDYNEFRSAVSSIPYKDENTNTADGIRKMRELFNGPGNRPDIPNIGIIVSDGVATRETSATLIEASSAKNEGVVIFGLGVGAQLDLNELTAIVGTVDLVYSVDDFDLLLADVNLIVGKACRALPPIPPKDPCYGKNLAFVLDASGSIGFNGFLKAKSMLKEFIRKIPLGLEFNKIALVSYSTKSYIHAKLGELVSYEAVNKVIDDIPFINRRTNLTGAINVLWKEIFPIKSEKNVAVVITDVKSNTDEHKLPYAAYWAKDYMKVFAVGIGEKSDMMELSLIASEPKYHFIEFAKDFDALSSVWTQGLFEKVCLPSYPLYEFDNKRECKSNIIFALDPSPRLGREGFEQQKALMKSLVSVLGGCDYSALVMGQFRAQATIDLGLGFNLQEFLAQADRLQYFPEEMSIPETLTAAKRILDTKPKARPMRLPGQGPYKGKDLDELLVVMTNGETAINYKQIELKLKELLERPYLGVMTLAVGDVDSTYLESFSSEPKSLFIHKMPSFDKFVEKATDIGVLIDSAIAKSVYECDFERRNAVLEYEPFACDFIDEGRDFKWVLKSGPTLSLETGPEGAFLNNFYAYVEASENIKGATATLISSTTALPLGDACLGFHYNMYGHHIGQLQVFTRDESGKEHVLWSVFGNKGKGWKLGMVHMMVKPGVSFGFKAIRGDGFSSDIAIDAVMVNKGVCPVEKQFNPYANYKLETGVNLNYLLSA